MCSILDYPLYKLGTSSNIINSLNDNNVFTISELWVLKRIDLNKRIYDKN